MPVGVQLVGRRFYDGRLLAHRPLAHRMLCRTSSRRAGGWEGRHELPGQAFRAASPCSPSRAFSASSSGIVPRLRAGRRQRHQRRARRLRFRPHILAAGGSRRIKLTTNSGQVHMAEKIRWGVISTALIGTKKVIPGIQRSKRGTVDAIASRDERRAPRRQLRSSASRKPTAPTRRCSPIPTSTRSTTRCRIICISSGP